MSEEIFRRHKRRKQRESVWWATETFYKPVYMTRAIDNGHHLDVLDFVTNSDINTTHVNTPDRSGRTPYHAAMLAEDPFALGALMTIKNQQSDGNADATLDYGTESLPEFPDGHSLPLEPMLYEAPLMHYGIDFLGLPGFHLGLAVPTPSIDLARCYILLLYNRLAPQANEQGSKLVDDGSSSLSEVPQSDSDPELDTLIREVASDIIDALPAPINQAVFSTANIDCEDSEHLTLLERCAERADYLLCKILIRAGASLRNSLEKCCAASSMNSADVAKTFTLLLNEYKKQSLFDRACVLRTLKIGIKNLAWTCVSEVLKFCDLSTEEFESLADYADTLNVSNEWVALVDKSIDGDVSHVEAHSSHKSLGLFKHRGCLDHLPYEPSDFPTLSKMANQHKENMYRLEVLLKPDVGILQCRLNSAADIRLYSWSEVTDLAIWADVARVHDSGYLQQIQELCNNTARHVTVDGMRPTNGQLDSDLEAIGQADDDTSLTSGSFTAALSAAQSVITAIKSVCLTRSHRNAFCCIRPPGHHVGTYGACQAYEGTTTDRAFGSLGFCLLNNVAIGAAWARYHLYEHGIRKIAIVDFDIHHGNGTETILRNLQPHTRTITVKSPLGSGLSLDSTIRMRTDRVWRDLSDHEDVMLYSIHGYDGVFYPGTGEGASSGIVNVPVTEAMSREEYMRQFRTGIIAPLCTFAPDLVLVSAGFDGHLMDSVGGARFGKLLEEDFEKMTRLLQRVANTYSKGRLVSVLEGGYSTLLGQASPFARSVYTHVRALATTYGNIEESVVRLGEELSVMKADSNELPTVAEVMHDSEKIEQLPPLATENRALEGSTRAGLQREPGDMGECAESPRQSATEPPNRQEGSAEIKHEVISDEAKQ